MISPKKIAGVGIVVRDLERSLAWYREKFGFVIETLRKELGES